MPLHKPLAAFTLSLVIVGALAGTIRAYELIGELAEDQKLAFLGISTALLLLLALSTTAGFEDFAKAASPWLAVQAGQRYKLLQAHERYLLEHVGEWYSVVNLFFSSLRSRKFVVSACCVIWGLIFLATQSAIAAISPLVEVQDGTNYRHTYLRPNSDITVPDLTCYHHWFLNETSFDQEHFSCGPLNVNDVPGTETQQAIAHRYGDAGHDALSQGSDCGSYDDLSEVLADKTARRYHCRRQHGRQEFAYRFREYHPEDQQDMYPSFTNRTIRASSGPCIEYNETEIGKDVVQLDAIVYGWNYTYSNGSSNGTLQIPTTYETTNGTTYIYRDMAVPQEATEWSCGPRCLWMWAHRSPGGAWGDTPSTFYACPVTVFPVDNAFKPEHEVSDGMARLAAAAIGLQGRRGGDTWQQWMQFQTYSEGTAWEIHLHELDEIGANMAEFAIASLSTLATLNDRITLTGDQPNLASYLHFAWRRIGLLLGSIAVIHALLFLGTAWVPARPEHAMAEDQQQLREIRPHSPAGGLAPGDHDQRSEADSYATGGWDAGKNGSYSPVTTKAS